MEKYREAFKHYAHLVVTTEEAGIDHTEALYMWRKFWEGIRCVAIYDKDITPEAFDDMLTWNVDKFLEGANNE